MSVNSRFVEEKEVGEKHGLESSDSMKLTFLTHPEEWSYMTLAEEEEEEAKWLLPTEKPFRFPFRLEDIVLVLLEVLSKSVISVNSALACLVVFRRRPTV